VKTQGANPNFIKKMGEDKINQNEKITLDIKKML